MNEEKDEDDYEKDRSCLQFSLKNLAILIGPFNVPRSLPS